MVNIIKDLYQHDTRFRFAFIFILAILVLSTLSFFSPYDPSTSFKVPLDTPPFCAASFRNQFQRTGYLLDDDVCGSEFASVWSFDSVALAHYLNFCGADSRV